MDAFISREVLSDGSEVWDVAYHNHPLYLTVSCRDRMSAELLCQALNEAVNVHADVSETVA